MSSASKSPTYSTDVKVVILCFIQYCDHGIRLGEPVLATCGGNLCWQAEEEKKTDANLCELSKSKCF